MEKAPSPITAKEPSDSLYSNSLIIQGKHLYSIAQKACNATLTSDLYIALVPLLLIGITLLISYLIGGM